MEICAEISLFQKVACSNLFTFLMSGNKQGRLRNNTSKYKSKYWKKTSTEDLNRS